MTAWTHHHFTSMLKNHTLMNLKQLTQAQLKNLLLKRLKIHQSKVEQGNKKVATSCNNQNQLAKLNRIKEKLTDTLQT